MDDPTQRLCAKLNALYSIIQELTTTSPEQDFNRFAAFFAEDCKVYLKSMNLHRMPGVTRQGAIEDMKETLEKVRVRERTVLVASATADGRTLFCETQQRLSVMGEVLDPFFETEIVTFDKEGLITELKLYNCWSPIVRIVQDKTGRGPYSEGEARAEWERTVANVAQKKLQRRKELLSNECCS